MTGGLVAPGVTRPYRDHAWVYAATTAIARNVAQVPFKLWVGETELSERDPLVQLFKRPNPLLSGYELFYATELYLQLTGNALWVPVPGLLKNTMAQIWVFSGKEIKPKVVGKEFIGWEVTRGDMREVFTYDEVIHFRYFNPYHPIMGMAPMEAARLAVDQAWWAQKYNEAFFQNFAEPGVIITFPGDFNAKVMQASRESWDQRHQGFNRAKKTAVLWGGAELKELGASKRDMEFIAQMKWGREEVLAVFHVPPVEVMLVDQVSSRVESQRAQRRLFGEEVVAPELKMFEDKILPLFTMVGRPEVRGWFDITEVSILQESYGEKIEQAKKLFDMMIPINAIVEKLDLGFERFAWGDEAFIAGTMLPASTLLNAPAPGSDDEEEDPEPDDDDEDDENEPTDEPEDEEPTDIEAGRILGTRARKLKRVFYELRNDSLKEKDGLGVVNWARVQRRLEPLIVDAQEVTERLQAWTAKASKEDVKAAYSRLKNSAEKMTRVEPKQKALPEVTSWSNEIIDRDALWYDYERQILQLELQMEARLVRYTNQWEKEFMAEFYRQPTFSFEGRDSDFNDTFDPTDTKLQETVQPVIENTLTQMGSCSVAFGTVPPLQTTHIPQSKADRSLAVKETKELVKLLGGQITDNNHNTDILVGKNAVEVKAITARKNDRVINMSPATKAAKLEYLEKNGLKGHTVVIDLREGKKLYYYSEGIGSRSLAQMRVVTEAELKLLIPVTAAPVGAAIEPALKVEQVLINNKEVLAGRDAALNAAKKYVEQNKYVKLGSSATPYYQEDGYLDKFLQSRGYTKEQTKYLVRGLREWIGDSHYIAAQNMTRTVSKWVGRDPEQLYVADQERSKGYFPESTELNKMYGEAKALAEEFYMKYMKRDHGFIMRGVKRHTEGLLTGKAKLGINTLSSWSTSNGVAKGFAGSHGVVVKDKIDRSSVWQVLPGGEWEVIAIHPKQLLGVSKDAIVQRGATLKKGDIFIALDNDSENANWLKAYRGKKK